jgi:hypothetical protein
MKTITEIIDNGVIVRENDNHQTQVGELNQFARQSINAIFKRLAHTFPAFKSTYRTEEERTEVMRVWVKGLIEANISTEEQIRRGMEKARRCDTDFFPSVGKFISWCKPNASELGMPDADSAWSEANRHSHNVLAHKWSHPAVYAAGKGCWFEIRAGSYKKEQYIASYERLIESVSRGEVIEGPAADSTKLEHQSGSKTTTEESKAAAAQALVVLKEGFGL